MKFSPLLLVVLVLLAIPVYAVDTSYFAFDASHPWSGDYQGSLSLCYMAADANVIVQTGWGNGMTAQQIFDAYAQHNNGGTTADGMQWYFSTYLPDVNWQNYYQGLLPISQAKIQGTIADHDGIALGLWTAQNAHVVTLEGYDLSDGGVIDAIYVSNSWYTTPQLERWTVSGGSPGELGQLDWAGLGPNPHWWYMDELEQRPVPEPGILLTLLVGLGGLAWWRKARGAS